MFNIADERSVKKTVVGVCLGAVVGLSASVASAQAQGAGQAPDVSAPDAGTPEERPPAPTPEAPVPEAVPPPAPPPLPPAPPALPPPVAEKAGPKLSGAPGKGVTFAIDDVFSMNVKLRFQLRGEFLAKQEDKKGHRDYDSLVNIQTMRLYFSGHAYKPNLQYAVQLAVAGRDFRDGATSPIFDAYFDWKIDRDFNIKAGQYFVPFDRLRTVREFALQMADRPIAVGEFTLDRDAGVTFYSERFLDTPLAWRVGAFGGGGTNQSLGKDVGGLLVGRLEARPLGPIDDDIEGDLERRSKPGLALGAGIGRNWNTNRTKSTTGATLAGGQTDYQHYSLDAVFKWAGFAAQGEYVQRDARMNQIHSIGTDGKPLTEYTRSGQGIVAQASYTFDPPVEIVGRLSTLWTHGATDPKLIADVAQRGQEVAGGINYYLNGHKLKLQTDWIGRMPRTFAFGRAEHLVQVLIDATL